VSTPDAPHAGGTARAAGKPVPASSPVGSPALDLQDLRVDFPTPLGEVGIVDGVSLSIARGEALGMVGESGSGKTMIALACLRMVPEPGRVAATRLRVADRDLLALDEPALCAVRGADVGVVFQNPMTAFNPVRTIGEQLAATWLRHRPAGGARPSRREARERAIAALREVGIAAPERRVDAYPHQMSGGMLQRALIAHAMINQPALIVADEPTTALDATVQAQILDLLRARLANAGLLLVTHDLGVAAEICDRVAVVYAGRVVEVGPARELLESPRHPYTQALLAAAPRLDPERRPLAPIPGAPPSPADLVAGCRYAPRCPRAVPRCGERPRLAPEGPHAYACWNPADDARRAKP
jgi:oligopeptide/dipeptide ABC transporter ATP-binding protein